MALVLKTALKTAVRTILKKVLKKVIVTGELTVTIYLQGVRKMQRQDPTLWHFFLGVTISLQLRLAYAGSASPNVIYPYSCPIAIPIDSL